MSSLEKIEELLHAAVDEVNATLPADTRVEKDPDAVLFGRGGTLDSLGLVSLIVACEGRIQDSLGTAIALADDRVMSEKRSPFRTLGTLRDYIASRLAEHAHV